MPTAKHRIAASLTDSEFGELADMAEKYEVSLSWLSRKAILEFIDRYRLEQLRLPLRPEPMPVVQPTVRLKRKHV